MKKIVIITPKLDAAGGLERMVTSLANELSKVYAVTLLITWKESPSFFTLDSRIEIKYLKADFGINSDRTYFQRKADFLNHIRSLKKAVEGIEPHLLISTTYPITVAVALTGLHKTTKVLNWEHVSYVNKKSLVWRFFVANAYKNVHCIVALNSDEERFYKKFNSSTIVIPNFIEPSNIISSLNAQQILTIARMEDVKGIDLLLQTAPIVLEKHPGWKWKLIAEGDLNKTYSKEISTYGQHKNFIHQTNTFEKVDAYQQASIYVMPSRVESFGMVPIEAMNYGVPCVAFDCKTGPKHIITHGKDGLLVEKENPLRLAEAVSSLIENSNLRKEMGKAAKEKATCFYKNEVMQQWHHLIENLI